MAFFSELDSIVNLGLVILLASSDTLRGFK